MGTQLWQGDTPWTFCAIQHWNTRIFLHKSSPLPRIFTSLKQTGMKEGKPPSSSSSSSSPFPPAASPFGQQCEVQSPAPTFLLLGVSRLENPCDPLGEGPGSWRWEISIRETRDAFPRAGAATAGCASPSQGATRVCLPFSTLGFPSSSSSSPSHGLYLAPNPSAQLPRSPSPGRIRAGLYLGQGINNK